MARPSGLFQDLVPGLAGRNPSRNNGLGVPALEARVLAGRVALDRGYRAAARHHLSVASKARMVGPADARARPMTSRRCARRTVGVRRRSLRSEPVSALSRIIRRPWGRWSRALTSVHIVAHSRGLDCACKSRMATPGVRCCGPSAEEQVSCSGGKRNHQRTESWLANWPTSVDDDRAGRGLAGWRRRRAVGPS